MRICDYCGNYHDGSFGSGRFCNTHCYHSYVASKGKGHHQNQVAWNLGLTKLTDSRVAINAAHLSETLKKQVAEGTFSTNPNSPNSHAYWTKERRLKVSIEKKQLYKDHPEKHPNRRLADNFNKLTYPESIAFTWLTEHSIEFIRNYRIGNRYADFYIPSKNLLIEIDGERWHPIGNAGDAKKDKDAAALGYTTLRIRFPSMNVIKTLENEFSRNQTKEFLQ